MQPFLTGGVGLQSVRLFDGLRARFLFVELNMDVPKFVETTLAGLGYELVDFELSGRGLMRIFIDKPEGIAMEDCERVSHHLARVLLVENIDYDRLEVSSPGLDRVLKKEVDFVRFTGQKAQVKVRVAVNGRKNFVGLLSGVQSGVLQMEIEGGSVSIELTNLDKARLVPVF